MHIYQHIIENFSGYALGKKPLKSAVQDTHKILQKKSKGLPLFEQINSVDTKAILATCKAISKRFSKVVVLGTGGASLTGQTLARLNQSHSGERRVLFLSNVDPQTVADTLGGLDITNAYFIVISKSGGTLETLSLFNVCLHAVAKSKKKTEIAEQFLVITDPEASHIRTIANNHKIPVIDHAADIGGRFSIFTEVGLIPAALAGVDIASLVKGAKSVAKTALEVDAAPLVGATLHSLFLAEKKYTCNVLVPYLDRLDALAVWYKQIWAESLGKQGKGSTPIMALGTIDQHSQLQLYLDGPKDKLFTLITCDKSEQGQKIDGIYFANDTLAYLHDKTLGEIFNAEYLATCSTLKEKGCPVREFKLVRNDAASFGALIMHLMLETIFVGYLIGVNPFDQPAVESIKVKTRQALK